MATTKTSYSVLSLDEAASAAAQRGFGLTADPAPEDGRRGNVPMRRDFDINSFGVNAFYQAITGAPVIGEHDELGPGASGHEELYVVIQGGCTFTVGGEEVAAPQGTAIFVRDPAVKRSAETTEGETIVLAVGGRPGEAFRPGPGEAAAGFARLYREGDYEGALAACREGLECVSRQRADALQHRLSREPARPSGRGARVARRIARSLAEVQGARDRRR